MTELIQWEFVAKQWRICCILCAWFCGLSYSMIQYVSILCKKRYNLFLSN